MTLRNWVLKSDYNDYAKGDSVISVFYTGRNFQEVLSLMGEYSIPCSYDNKVLKIEIGPVYGKQHMTLVRKGTFPSVIKLESGGVVSNIFFRPPDIVMDLQKGK